MIFFSRRWAKAVGLVSAIIVAAVVVAFWMANKGGLTDSQRSTLAKLQSHIADRQAVKPGRVQLGCEQLENRVDLLMLDGMLTSADLDEIFAIQNTPFAVSDAFFEFKKVPIEERAKVTAGLNGVVRGNILAGLACWTEASMPMDPNVRDRIMAKLLDTIAHGREPNERRSAFTSLNVMGALDDQGVREKALAAAANDDDPATQQLLSAWKNGQKYLKEQASGKPKGQP